MKILKKIGNFVFPVLLILSLVSISTVDVFAAAGSRTYNSTKKMSVILPVKTTGDSSEIQIRVSDLPKKAVITKMIINTGSLSYTGAVVTNYLTIKSSNNRTEQIPWNRQANKNLTTNGFLASLANGTYTLKFNATCVGGAIIYGKMTDIGTKTYSRPSITIYWYDSF